MSEDGASAEWVPPGWPQPSSGQAPAVATPWPPVLPIPETRPGRLASWLADPAASPLLAAAAVATAAGWSAAAAVLATTVATGHPVAALAGAAVSTAIALPVADLVILLSRLGRVQSARPDAARAFRKAARRAHRSSGVRPGLMRSVRGSARSLRRPARFPALPRPARWGFAAMLWLTVVAAVWALARDLPAWGSAQISGQQLAASAWMMHLVVWYRIACTRLNRSRSRASMLARSAGGEDA